MIISPYIHFVTDLEVQPGFGDELMDLQWAVQQCVTNSSNKIIEIMYYPIKILNYKWTGAAYKARIARLIELRLKAHSLHPIEFIIFDYHENIIHKIASHRHSIIEDSTYIDMMEKIKEGFPKDIPVVDKDGIQIKDYETMEDSFRSHGETIRYNFTNWLKDNISELILHFKGNNLIHDYDRNIQIFEKISHEYKVIVGWPKGEKINGGKSRVSYLKSTLLFNFEDKKGYKSLPYRTQYSKENSFNYIQRAKYVIGPEGGMYHLSRMCRTPFIMLLSDHLFKTKIQTLWHMNYYMFIARKQNWLAEQLCPKIENQGFCFEPTYRKEFQELEEKIEAWLPNWHTESAIFLPNIKRRHKYTKQIELLERYLQPITSKVTLY